MVSFNDVRDLDWITIGLIVVGVILIVQSFWIAMTAPVEHDYRYEVKTEQVQSDSHSIEESKVIQYEDLTGAEQDAVYKAYKKSDSFLSGSSVSITSDEQLNVEQDSPNWMVVEAEGVRLLVGIVFMNERIDPSSSNFLWMIGTSILGLLLTFRAHTRYKSHGLIRRTQ